jgi:putative phosphoesterase
VEVVRVGVIADTHIPTSRRSLPVGVTRRFAGVELILHAGDLVVPDVLETLGTVAPVRAVRGNNDWGIELPERLVVEVEELAIGLVHIRPERGDAASFFGRHVDLVVFGHTHRPTDEVEGGVRWLNPGSPTSLRLPAGERGFPFRRGPGTVGLLEVEGGTARFEVLPVDG